MYSRYDTCPRPSGVTTAPSRRPFCARPAARSVLHPTHEAVLPSHRSRGSADALSGDALCADSWWGDARRGSRWRSGPRRAATHRCPGADTQSARQHCRRWSGVGVHAWHLCSHPLGFCGGVCVQGSAQHSVRVLALRWYHSPAEAHTAAGARACMRCNSSGWQEWPMCSCWGRGCPETARLR